MAVSGVLAPTGGQEDGMIFAPLPFAQAFLSLPGQLSMVEVSALCRDCPVDDIVGQIARRLPNARVSAVQQTVRAREETVERLGRFSMMVSAIVLAIAALLIFTTMMASVMERTREIGVLRAIGFRKSHIVKGIMLETLIVSALGGMAGIAAGLLSGRAALPYFTDSAAAVRTDPLILSVAMLLALGVGLAASIYPARRASRMEPSDAIRSL